MLWYSAVVDSLEFILLWIFQKRFALTSKRRLVRQHQWHWEVNKYKQTEENLSSPFYVSHHIGQLIRSSRVR